MAITEPGNVTKPDPVNFQGEPGEPGEPLDVVGVSAVPPGEMGGGTGGTANRFITMTTSAGTSDIQPHQYPRHTPDPVDTTTQ